LLFCKKKQSTKQAVVLEDHRMTLVRSLVRWSCFTAAAASLSIPSFSAEKKKEAAPAASMPSYYGPQPETENVALTMYSRIREEGFKHSHVMQFADALSDGIGPRLTGSPNMASSGSPR
jgi:carboxypeptidase Q